MDSVKLPDIKIEVWRRGGKVLSITRHKVVNGDICCWISNGDKLRWNANKMWINDALIYDCDESPDLMVPELYKWHLIKNGYKIL